MVPSGKLPDKSKQRSLFLPLATLVLMMVAAFYAVAMHGRIITRRTTGFTLDREMRVNNVGSASQIRKGEQLVAWRQGSRGGRVTSVFGWLKTTETLKYGKVELIFKEAGAGRRVVTLTISRPPLWPKLGFTLTPLLVCVLALALIIRRKGEGEIRWLMVITLVATYILTLGYSNLDALAASPFYLISFLVWNVLAPPSLLLFFLRYPYRKEIFRGRVWIALTYLPAVLAFGITSILYLRFYGDPTPARQESLLNIGRLLIPGTNFMYGVGMVWAIFHSLFKGPSNERRRMILVVYGLFIILLMISSWVFLYSTENALAQITAGPDLLMIMHLVLSISLYASTSQAWVLLATRLVNRGVVYGVITIGIVIFYLLLAWVLGLLLSQMFGITSKTVTIFAAVLATAGLFSLREFVQRHVDRMFFRTRYRYSELLKETSERLASIMELPRLFSSLLKVIGASMKLQGGGAWIVKRERGELLRISTWGQGDALPPTIKYGRVKRVSEHGSGSVLLRSEAPELDLFAELSAQCVVPLEFQGELYGLIALGDKIEELPYTKDDVDLLESIGKQAAIAVKNSMSYTTILNLNASLASSKQEIERLKARLEVENVYLKKAVMDAGRFGDIVGESDAMRDVKELTAKIAPTGASVLILGESGTGKELLAQTIHALSGHDDRPLVTVNCAAIPANLLESELFGHVKGAFTGATRRKVGQFELADGGTLFLDEIGELPLELQPKILRALQEGEITPVGAEKPLKVTVRLITATNRELETMVADGRFREDLYYRINVVPVTLPPLRQRDGDIPILSHYFLESQSKRMGKRVTGFTRDAMERLEAYPWPGNVRELSNVIERAVALSGGELLDSEVMLPALRGRELASPKKTASHEPKEPLMEGGLPYKEAVEAFKRQYISEVLEKVGGNKSEAARLIGLRRPYLHKLIKELGVDDT